MGQILGFCDTMFIDPTHPSRSKCTGKLRCSQRYDLNWSLVGPEGLTCSCTYLLDMTVGISTDFFTLDRFCVHTSIGALYSNNQVSIRKVMLQIQTTVIATLCFGFLAGLSIEINHVFPNALWSMTPCLLHWLPTNCWLRSSIRSVIVL